jgi:hypothetical protein
VVRIGDGLDKAKRLKSPCFSRPNCFPLTGTRLAATTPFHLKTTGASSFVGYQLSKLVFKIRVYTPEIEKNLERILR